MARPRFRIYYGDNSVWTWEDGPWNKAPRDDVQVVMIDRGLPDYREIVQGVDEYRIPELGVQVKYGKQMDGRKYNALVRRAIRDGF
jgi:glyoxylase-like metal-dependent hydrolase (beta-lactamase superfamily II)